MTYRIVIEKDGRNIRRLYWAGSLEETRRLARKIACKYVADGLRIFELGGAEVCFEQGPFGCALEAHSSEATDNKPKIPRLPPSSCALDERAFAPAFKSLRSNRPLTFLALTRRVRRSVDRASWLRRVAFARRLQAAIIGALGGLVGLGGAEFRLPLLSEFSRFAALQPIIPWSHRRCRARLAELLLLTSHQASGDGIP